MDGVLLTGAAILGGITTAVQTASSYDQARQQNRANRAAAASEREAAKIAAEARKAEVERESQAFQGSVRASSAARGAAGSASSLALALSGVAQAQRASTNIDTQLGNNITSINSRARAQFVDPFAATFNSGLSGLNASLGLVSTAAQLEDL